MIIRKLKRLKSFTLLIFGLFFLLLSFAPFLFIKELPPGNKGQLLGLFSMLWTVFTMIPALLLTASGFIISINNLIQTNFKLHQILSIGISGLLLSKSSLLITGFIPKFHHTMLNDIISLILGFFEFFLLYPSIILIIIGIVLTIRTRKNDHVSG